MYCLCIFNSSLVGKRTDYNFSNFIFLRNIRTIKNGYESITYHRLYKRTILDNVQKQKDEQDRILKAYQENIDSVKEGLELSTPKYKLLKEKRIELQQFQIRCMQMKQKIEERRKINQQKMEIQKKMFYAQIIALAKAWIERRDYLATMEKFEELSTQEREWMIKVMDSTEQLKQKKKMRKLNEDNCVISFGVIFNKSLNLWKLTIFITGS